MDKPDGFTETSWHRAAVAESGIAYKVTRRGRKWRLACAWCPHEAHGGTKREALAAMTEHYDSLDAAVELV